MPASSSRLVTSSTASAPASTRSSWPAAYASTAGGAGSPAWAGTLGPVGTGAILGSLQQGVVVRRRQDAAGVAGVHHARGLDQQHRDVAVGQRAVLDAARHHVELSGGEGQVVPMALGVAQLQGQGALDDEEQLVGVVVGVPDELALELGELDLVVVEAGHHLG